MHCLTLKCLFSSGHSTAPWCFLCACVAKLQLIRKSSVDQVIPMLPSTIKPVMRDAFVEITALGARDLQPFALQPIYLPFVSCARGEGSWEKGWYTCSVGLVASTAFFAKYACGLMCYAATQLIYFITGSPANFYDTCWASGVDHVLPLRCWCKQVEFDCGERHRSTDQRKTKTSKSPSGANPNFLEVHSCFCWARSADTPLAKHFVFLSIGLIP